MNWSYMVANKVTGDASDLISEAAIIKDILLLAVKMEKNAESFYLAGKEKANTSDEKKTFQQLAEAEAEHLQKLYQCASTTLGDKALPPLPDSRPALKVERVRGGVKVRQVLAKITGKVADYKEALERGLEKEYLAHDLYQLASQRVNNTEVKALLDTLSSEERGHARVILERLDELMRRDILRGKKVRL